MSMAAASMKTPLGACAWWSSCPTGCTVPGFNINTELNVIQEWSETPRKRTEGCAVLVLLTLPDREGGAL